MFGMSESEYVLSTTHTRTCMMFYEIIIHLVTTVFDDRFVSTVKQNL